MPGESFCSINFRRGFIDQRGALLGKIYLAPLYLRTSKR